MLGVWVVTHGGRGRYLPGLFVSGYGYPASKIREDAERRAFNHVIQGTAADLMKQAMVKARAAVDGFFPLLQIHDELVGEFYENRGAIGDNVVTAMNTQLEGVSIPANLTTAEDWGGLK